MSIDWGGGRDEEVARAYVTDGQRDRKLLEHIRESMKFKYRVHITWEYYKVYNKSTKPLFSE